jgi:hypothetical protein
VSTDSHAPPRRLPDHPNLRRLNDDAKDLLRSGASKSIADAQFKIARLYGFASVTAGSSLADPTSQIRNSGSEFSPVPHS